MVDLMRRAGRSFWSMLNWSDIFRRRRRRSFWFGGLVWAGAGGYGVERVGVIAKGSLDVRGRSLVGSIYVG